ncbi:MAG: TolC family protein [Thermodesulfobacteriota bacterium]
MTALALHGVTPGAGLAAATTPAPATMELSIEEGIAMLLKHNLDIVVERIKPRIETARVEGGWGIFDREVFTSLNYNDSKRPLNSRSSTAAGSISSMESRVYTLNMGVSAMTTLGTEYSLEFDDEWTKDTLNDFDTEHDTFAGLRLTQPLLKGFGRDATLFEIGLAKKERDISVHRLKQRIIDTVSEFELTYWELVLTREELRVKSESLKLAEELLELNRSKFEAGVASALEVTQAEAGVATRREALISAGKLVSEGENALKLLISGDVYGLRDTEIVPTDAPPPPTLWPMEPSLQEGVRKAVEVRPDYNELRAELEKNDIRIKYAENQRFPEVDLEASFGYNGLGTSFNNSIEGMDSNPQWGVGVVFRYPLGNRTARSEERIARLESEAALFKLKRLEQEIVVALDNAIKELHTSRERFGAAKVSTRFAEETLIAEEVKLEAGLSTTYNVLEMQEDLEEAKLSEIDALIDYASAVTVFLREEGTLLDKRGIEFRLPEEVQGVEMSGR